MPHWWWDPLEVLAGEMTEHKHVCCTEVPDKTENNIHVFFLLEIPIKVEYICIRSRYTGSMPTFLHAKLLVTKQLCFNFSLKENNAVLQYCG